MFSQFYKLKSNDVIFVSSPPTFDPFVLDLLLALTVGASVALVAASLRVPTPQLASILFDATVAHPAVTIMQITPSLFKRFPIETIRHVVLAPQKTTLRLLAFGGEPFPCHADLCDWVNWHDAQLTTKFVNIYGCTEMSCWSTIHEIRPIDVLQNAAIALGRPICGDCVIVLVDTVTGQPVLGNGIGELQLASEKRYTRRYKSLHIVCKTVKTGDLVERRNDEYYYVSRCSDVVKRYGNRVDLKRIQQVAQKCNLIEEACCVFDTATNTLGLFVQTHNACQEDPLVWKHLKRELEPKELPDIIQMVDSFPLSKHGKKSKQMLVEMLAHSKPRNVAATEYFRQRLADTLGIDVPSVGRRSFMDVGGTSFWALSIVSELEKQYECSLPVLMGMLLDQTTPIADLLSYIGSNAVQTTRTLVDEVIVYDEPEVFWKHDLRKCVDATPTILVVGDVGDELVSVGSHSHRLYTMATRDGTLVSELVLPHRIESRVRQIGASTLAVVGCYDGALYCFDVMLGFIQWTFQSGAMIKCRPVCVADDRIVFGNYSTDRNLWCVNVKVIINAYIFYSSKATQMKYIIIIVIIMQTGALVWSTRVGAKSIYANQLVLHETTLDLLVCTLDGTFARVDSKTGQSVWTKSWSSPIFSTPHQIEDSAHCLIAEVSGIVHCIDLDGVEVRLNYQTYTTHLQF